MKSDKCSPQHLAGRKNDTKWCQIKSKTNSVYM